MCKLTEDHDCAKTHRPIVDELGQVDSGQSLRDLYPTLDEFRSAMPFRRPELLMLAKAIGAHKNCHMCRVELADLEVFEEAVCSYYGIPKLDAQMSSEIRQSGLLASDAIMKSLCTVCAEIIFALPV